LTRGTGQQGKPLASERSRPLHLEPLLAVAAAGALLAGILVGADSTRRAGHPPRGGAVVAPRAGADPTEVPIVVNVYEYGFSPSRVVIRAGQAVAWKDVGDELHTITPRTKEGEKVFVAAARRGAFSHVFPKPGVYPYYCSIHPQMKGSVTVVASFPRHWK